MITVDEEPIKEITIGPFSDESIDLCCSIIGYSLFTITLRQGGNEMTLEEMDIKAAAQLRDFLNYAVPK